MNIECNHMHVCTWSRIYWHRSTIFKLTLLNLKCTNQLINRSIPWNVSVLFVILWTNIISKWQGWNVTFVYKGWQNQILNFLSWINHREKSETQCKRFTKSVHFTRHTLYRQEMENIHFTMVYSHLWFFASAMFLIQSLFYK